MSKFLTEKFFSLAIALFSLTVIAIVTVASIDSVGGDASIYLAYAKNFWDTPFSIRPNGPPEFGATGPLWVLWLSFFGDNFILLKLFNFLTVCLSFFLGIRYLKFFYFLPLLILFLGSFIFMNALIYEAPLFLLILTCIFINIFGSSNTFLTNSNYLLGLLIGFLIILRPEAIFLLPLILLNKKNGILLVNLFMMILPIAIYQLYMFLGTGGEVIPSSIYERIIRHGFGESSSSRSIFNIAESFLEHIAKPLYLLGLFSLLMNTLRDKKWLSFLLSYLAFYIVLSLMDSPRWRYFLLLDLIAIFSISQSLYIFQISKSSFRTKVVSYAFVATLVLSNFSLNFGRYLMSHNVGENAKSTFAIRLAPDLEEELDKKNIGIDDKILIYEFGSQYSSKREFISVDGIIGKFPKRFSSVRDFEVASAQSADYFVSSHGCYRSKFRDSFFSIICDFEKKNLWDQDTLETENVVLTLISKNPDFDPDIVKTTWNGIYKITLK